MLTKHPHKCLIPTRPDAEGYGWEAQCVRAIQKAYLFGGGECICLSINNVWMFEPSVLTPETSLSLTIISQISPSICQNKSKWSIFNFRKELNQIVVHTDLNPKASLLLLRGSWGMHIQIDLPMSSGITESKPVEAILDGRRVSGDKISWKVFLFLWKKRNFSSTSFSCFSPNLSFLFGYGNVFQKTHTQAEELGVS